jgi:hypothetical protein
MAYEVLSAIAARSPAGEPMLSISAAGRIRVNTDATKLLRAMGAERVLLLWDKDKRKIAITPADKHDNRSYKLKINSAKGVAEFAAKATMRAIGWSSVRTLRIAVHQTGKMLEGTMPEDALRSKVPHARGLASPVEPAKDRT